MIRLHRNTRFHKTGIIANDKFETFQDGKFNLKIENIFHICIESQKHTWKFSKMWDVVGTQANRRVFPKLSQILPNFHSDPIKAGFHKRRSCSQKHRAIRSSENQTLILLMSPSLTIKWKLHCRSRKQKQKNKPMTMFNSRQCDWLDLLLLLPTPTTQSSQDNKQRSRKRNWKKRKCSDSFDSDSIELMTPLTTPIFNFH